MSDVYIMQAHLALRATAFPPPPQGGGPQPGRYGTGPRLSGKPSKGRSAGKGGRQSDRGAAAVVTRPGVGVASRRCRHALLIRDKLWSSRLTTARPAVPQRSGKWLILDGALRCPLSCRLTVCVPRLRASPPRCSTYPSVQTCPPGCPGGPFSTPSGPHTFVPAHGAAT